MSPAIFLDRDGTVIEHVHHLIDPSLVKLIDGAAEAIKVFQRAGYACVIVTNQSVIGRGLLTLEGLDRIHEEMNRQLAEHGVTIDGIYFSPHAPKCDDMETIDHPDRKPGPGMLLRAADELNLDVSRSWMIGDSLSDVLAGRNAGCRGTMLVRTGCGAKVDADHPAIDEVVNDLGAAPERILNHQTQR